MRSTVVRNSFFSSFQFFLLLLFTIIIDLILHLTGFIWIGRYFGLIGTSCIIISFIYSLRKRKFIKSGSVKGHLAFHEYMSFIGALMLLVHAGIHFNALLPWLAIFAMLVSVASGMTGRYLLNKSILLLNKRKSDLKEGGNAQDMIDDKLMYDSIAVDLMRKWRVVHLPITLIFAILAIAHIIYIIMYAGRF